MSWAWRRVVAVLLFFLIPRQPAAPRNRRDARATGRGKRRARSARSSAIRNPSCAGLIAGLMFLPTTIFDMVWGVRFLQEATTCPTSLAVMRSASVPFGWIIGCPLLGVLSDRIGRRKPVIAGGAVVLLSASC